MIYHPTLIILTSILALSISYRQEKLFNILALGMPIIAGILFYYLPTTNSIELYNLTLIYEGSSHNKLIGTAFLLVLFSANLYAVGQKKYLEIILGSAYAAFAFLSLLAGDFISMFIGLELMMVASSAIIFIGGSRTSLRSAKKYFLTHFVSSNMIIIGITYLIAKGNSLELVNVMELMNNPEYSTVILAIMLTGMLINIAVFPFSGWMVNYYPKASPTGFLYLISFTTKLSVMLLIKLFAGYDLLKYVAIIMMCYASTKAIFEDNLLSLLCYLSIMSMSVMLLAISSGSDAAIAATVSYLFIHIIYKSLLSISVASIIDYAQISNCSELKKIHCKILLTGLFIGIAMMISIPMAASFYVKSAISQLFSESPIYFIIVLSGFMMVFALPWKGYLFAKKNVQLNLNIYSKLSILFMTIILFIVGILGRYLPVLSELVNFTEIKLLSIEPLKQIAIIVMAILLSTLYGTTRKHTKPINLIEWIGYTLLYYYRYWTKLQNNKETVKEPWSFSSLEQQSLSKISTFHSQQTAIFIVVTLFIVMLIGLNYLPST